MAQSIVKGKQGRNSRQEWKQTPQGAAAYWLALYGLQNHLLRDGPTHRGLDPPTLSKKMACRLVYRQSDGGIFSTEAASS